MLITDKPDSIYILHYYLTSLRSDDEADSISSRFDYFIVNESGKLFTFASITNFLTDSYTSLS